VAFLNDRSQGGALDLDSVEAFWIARVREFFAAKPFVLRVDLSNGVQSGPPIGVQKGPPWR